MVLDSDIHRPHSDARSEKACTGWAGSSDHVHQACPAEMLHTQHVSAPRHGSNANFLCAEFVESSNPENKP